MARSKDASSTPRPSASKSRKTLVAQPLSLDHDDEPDLDHSVDAAEDAEVIRVRRMHRRDIKRVWEFLLRVFRDVNQKTVELQRPRSRRSFEESYDNEGIEQLIFEISGVIVGYAESTFEVTGADNWANWRWFDARDIRPLFVEELAVSPDYQGRGVGGFMLEQLRHIGALRGCTHLVLEVAENNEEALKFYRKRNFFKLDAAIFLAQKIDRRPELLPPRPLKPAKEPQAAGQRRGKAIGLRPEDGAPKKPPASRRKTLASRKADKPEKREPEPEPDTSTQRARPKRKKPGQQA